MIKALAVMATFLVLAIPTFAAELPADGGSFLAVTPSVLMAHARLSDSDKTVVQSYIASQIALNNLSVAQFSGLTSDQQRVVLAPGKAFTFSREVKRSIVPLRQAVPASVIKKIAVNQPLSVDVIDAYGIDLPASITAELPQLPAGYQRLLVGSQLILLDGNNVVLDNSTLKI